MPTTPDDSASRLLLQTLREERRATAWITSTLLGALALKLVLPLLLAAFVDRALAGESARSLTIIAGVYVVAALLAEALSLVVVRGAVAMSYRAGNRIRERLAAAAIRLDMAWHGRHSPGLLIERIDGDVSAVTVFFTQVVVHVVGNSALVAGIVVVAFVLDPAAGALLAATSIAAVAVMARLRRSAIAAREIEREANARLYSDLEERLGGLEDLRANGAGQYALHRLHQNSAVVWAAMRAAARKSDSAYGISAMVFALGTVSMIGVGAVLHARGALSVGAVVALYRYSDMMRGPLEQIAEQMKEFQKAMAGARRISELLATDTTVPDGSGADLPTGALSVQFDAVTLRYGPDDPPALVDVSLDIAPGATIGVVGRTGSGKTTAGRLVSRLWDVKTGAVRIGGVDVRSLDRATLRSRVAIVTQEVDLFRASIRDNVTMFGALVADDVHLEAVLRQVGLGPWLAKHDYDLGAIIEGPAALSAGEAQLLAFARAFLKDPGVVVLDEASSRLDPATESRVAAATRELLSGRTAIVIAHRLATLDKVDEIAVLGDGRILEHGTRGELANDPTSRFGALLRAGAAAGPLDAELDQVIA